MDIPSQPHTCAPNPGLKEAPPVSSGTGCPGSPSSVYRAATQHCMRDPGTRKIFPRSTEEGRDSHGLRGGHRPGHAVDFYHFRRYGPVHLSQTPWPNEQRHIASKQVGLFKTNLWGTSTRGGCSAEGIVVILQVPPSEVGGRITGSSTLQRAATMSQADVSTCSAPQRVFQEAVKKGNTKELHSLLQNMTNCEFNVNSFGPEGQTALHQSVIDGNLELVKLLVKFGADIRLANREGWSALHIAAFGGHQDIVLYLITKAKYSSGAR
ncbi:hypothetical protein Q8A73_019853 [Channa argus]|nr:hypothetical protein Q8A73_019853 [Channa argus]